MKLTEIKSTIFSSARKRKGSLKPFLKLRAKEYNLHFTKKITQKNSFEIPLKVVENDEQFMLKTRFWKFASELLGASVSIYDKRVENTWLTANKIDSKLKRIRINKKDFKDDEEEEETTKRKSNQDFIVL